MNKETFKDEKGTFHYEPVVWGDWKEGDKVVFEGFTSGHNHWSFIEGYTYTVGVYGSNMGPVSNKGEITLEEFGFKFSRKVYDVVEELNIKTKDKKWNEYPFSFPPVNTLAMVEYDTSRQERYKGYIVCHGNDEEGDYCQFQWLEGPRTNQTTYYYTPESFKPLLPVENKEDKDSTRQENSLDNLLKELHNLKQEEKEISAKIDNVLKEINSVVGLYGLSVLFKNEHDVLQEND